MKNHLLFYSLTFSLFFFQSHAAPPGSYVSSLMKWTMSTTSKFPHSDGNFLQIEDGYVVETVVEGNMIGSIPYRIRVSEEDGDLFVVDAINSNIVRITPPLSQYSRGRLVAGSFKGSTGHIDGKPSDARFNHPKGVTMDDKGNVYVADTQNMAIRRIGDAGVTTIAGGKSNVAGYRDGPSEDAKFSNDFDVVYIRPTCSLLVIDRGNAALRQISLGQEDCNYQSSSISSTDILTVVGAVIVGYATCMLQQGFGSSFFSKMQPSGIYFKGQASNERSVPIQENSKEEPGWPSFGQLIVDLFKISVEALMGAFIQLIPSHFRSDGLKRGLTPLKGRLRMPEDEVDGPKRDPTPQKDCLRMPEDEVQPPLANMQSFQVPPLTENRKQVHPPSTAKKYTELKPPKIRSTSFKDPSLSSKERPSKRPEYAEFYGSTESPTYTKSKSQKERPRHQSREKSGEAVFGASGADAKPVDTGTVDYNNLKFDHYSMRTKYVSGGSFRFNSQ
ncbi:putative six-bladed beta-propeller, TolB [Lupinus albus]|uniref:Putative six-bladed beta-propeller, TolB n=1 Tax=Lupinus albus TaxID=3870 RepID=A0A6A4NNU5_LUPAL|nr:putative six-bladed beta-propeller, TolB [Lupinus albus]